MTLNWAVLEHQQNIVILTDCLSAVSAIKVFHENRNFLVKEVVNLVKDFKLIRMDSKPMRDTRKRKSRSNYSNYGERNSQRLHWRIEASKWILSIIKRKWNWKYLKIPTGQHFKIFFPTVFQTDNLGDRPTRCHRIIFRLRTWHCRLSQHLFKIGVTDSPSCHHCKSEQFLTFLYFVQNSDLRARA